MAEDPLTGLGRARRMEIAGGLLGLAMAAAFWLAGGLPTWLPWVVLACALLALVPWLGPAAIIRRAQRDPPVLAANRTPEQRRRRARRAVALTVAYIVVGTTVLGLVLDGPGAAVACAVIAAVCVVPGAWLALRRTP